MLSPKVPSDQSEALQLQEFIGQLTLSQGRIRAFI